MAVDRGELRYKIQVDDNFTRPLRQFREEVLKAKATLDFVKESTGAFEGLRGPLAGATSAVRQFRQASNTASQEEREANRETQRRLREIANDQRKRAQVEKLRADVLREQRAEAERTAAAEVRAARATEQAQRRALAAAREAERVQARAAREAERAAKQQAAAARAASAGTRRFREELLGTGEAVNRVSFTFRRLFGILAAFTIAREAVGAFSALIGASVQFNRTVEDSAIGLGSLIAASSDITDAAGNLLTGADGFKAATAEARRQGELLRQDALLTTATYEQLLVAFQAAVGPGLAAGLKVDEVRKVAVNISQAAAALGLEQNQLAEEVRSTITGTGQLRTTRLAQLISNEDIRAAREAGTLFQLITDRLRPFAFAAEETQKTLTGLLARLQDAVGLAGGRASLVFFEQLKTLVADLGDLFVDVQRNADGVIEAVTPKPEAVASLAIIFDGLQKAVLAIRSGIQSLSLTEVQNALAGISGLFGGIGEVVAGLVDGLVGGLSDVSVLVSEVFGGIDTGVLREAASLVARVGTFLIAASLGSAALVGSFKLLVAPAALVVSFAGRLLTLVAGVLGVIGRLPGSLLTSAGLVGTLVFGFKQVAESILGVELGIKDLPEVLGATVEQAAAKFLSFIETTGTAISVRIRQAFTSALAEIQVATLAVKNFFDEALAAGGSSDAAVRIVNREAEAVKLRRDAAKDIAALELEINEARKVGVRISDDADKRAGDRIATLQARIAALQGDNLGIPVKVDTKEAESGLLDFLKSVNSELAGLIGGDIVDENAVLAKVDALVKEVEKRTANFTGKAQKATLTEFDKSIQELIKRQGSLLESLQSAVTGFANFAADAIVGAFDPTNDTDIEVLFARFLQGLAKQILSTIFTLLIATAIAKAFGVPLPAGDSNIPGGFPTLAEGGSVPDTGAPIPRPASVPKTDTTLAWLTPNEFVQPVEAVRRYGSDVMEALRRGLIDPVALRGLAGLGAKGKQARKATVRAGAVAAAEGGLIPALSAQRAAGSIESATSASQPSVVGAVVVGNERQADRLLAGGRQALLQWIARDGAAIESILSKNRR